VLYRNEGKYAEAETTLKSALEARRRAMGEEHRDTFSSMNALGLLYSIEGKFADAEPLLIDSASRAERVMGADNPDAQSNLSNLAELYRREGKLQSSEISYQKLLTARQRTYGPDNPFTANTLGALGEVEIQMRRFKEAAVVLRRATDFYTKHKVDVWRRYYTECLFGQSLIGTGKRAEGEAIQTAAFPKLLQRKDSIPPEYRGVLQQVKPPK
jgi:tetratricopeptide (TPR) repeat protein